MINIKQQLIKNSASTILQIIASFISGLVLPPILISKLGFTTYGIWGLVLLLNQYSLLFDLGLQSGFIKLSSEYITKGDNHRVNSLFSSNIFLYFFTAILISSILFLFKEPIMQVFFGDAFLYKNLFDIALLYSFTSVFNLLTFPFSSLLKGLQRYDISNAIDIIFVITNAVLSIIFILLDFGLFGLVLGYLISLIIKFLLLIVITRKIFPELTLYKISKPMVQDFKLLFAYAPADLSVKVYSAVTQTLIRFSLKNYAGISYVGVYDIAKRLVSQVLGISSSIFVPFLPAMSLLSTQNRRDDIASILRKASLFMNLFCLPIIFYLLLFFEPILTIWLNISSVSDIQFAGSILLMATIFDLYTGPITTSSLGFGTIRLYIYKLGIAAIILFALVFLLGKDFSFKGILLAELISYFISMIFSFWFFDKIFKYKYTSNLLKAFFDISKVSLPIIFSFFLIWILFKETLQAYFIIFGIISLISSFIFIIVILLRLDIITKNEFSRVRDAFKIKDDRSS